MKTVIIQIGNSDNKLTQKEWSEFVRCVDIYSSVTDTHFRGVSNSDAPWQNACWVLEVEDYNYDGLKRTIGNLESEFKQDSIAWTEGITKFI